MTGSRMQREPGTIPLSPPFKSGKRLMRLSVSPRHQALPTFLPAFWYGNIVNV